MSVPKWTEDRENALISFVGDESPVSQVTVAEAATNLETTTRSVSSKLRKMGYEVESAAAATSKAFTDRQEATLRTFVENNSGEYTYAQIAASFEDGTFSAKQIQGKVLSMELTEHVKPAEKVAVPRTYTPSEEQKFIAMANDGAFVEDIAEALGKTVQSVRGKALSLLRSEHISEIPKQKVTKASNNVDPLENLGNVAEMSVEDIAEAIGKSPRGVKVMLTRRGIDCANYNGAARREKADKATEATA